MNPYDRQVLFELRCKVRRGHEMTQDEFKYYCKMTQDEFKYYCKMTQDEFKYHCKMFHDHPDEYRAMSKEIFDETHPWSIG